MFLWKINQIWKTDDNISIDSTHSYEDISSKLFQNSEKIISEFVKHTEGNERKATQLLKSWQDSTARKVKKFKWKYTLSTCNETNNIVIITITETFKGIPTSGGSSFIILQTSAHTKDFCPITDLFNGTYIARCIFHEDVTNIKGTVDFVNFIAFTQMAKPMKKKLFDFPVIISQSHSTTTARSRGMLLLRILFSSFLF